MANTTIEFLSLTGLCTYDANIKAFIESKVADGDAKSFKYVNLVDRVLKFYTINPISDDTVPAYEIELPEQDLSNLMQLVVNATAGNVAVFGEGGQVADTGIKAADIAMKTDVDVVDAKADKNAEDIANITNADTGILKQAKDYADGKDAAIVAAQTAADQAKADIDSLELLVGTLPAGTTASTVVEYINVKTAGIATDAALEELQNQLNGAQEAIDEIEKDYLKVADKEELAAAIKVNTDIIEVLNGEGEGSVKKAVDDAINKFATDVTNDEVVNSYKELIDWAAEHGAEAAKMVAAIEANELAISDLEKLVGVLPEGETSADIVAYIQKLVNAEADRAGEAEEDLAGRIEELEGKFIGENSVDAKITAAVAAEKAEREAADELKADKTALEATNAEVAKKADITALNDEITAREAADAQVLVDAKADTDAKIAAEVTARDNAIAAAKAEAIADAEGKNAELKTTLETALKKYADDEDAKIESRVDALEAKDEAFVKSIEAINISIGNNTTAIAGKASSSDLNAMGDRVVNIEKDVETLKGIEYVAITTEQINALFA